MTNNNIEAVLVGAMKNMQFLRYNIPEELGAAIRPLSSADAKTLQNLHLKYKRGDWSAKDTDQLLSVQEKADERAKRLEELLTLNNYNIREKDGEKKVTSKNSDIGRHIIFTWQMPEYEEYDGGLLSQQTEEEFLADVMSGAYDSKYDKEYLAGMYPEDESKDY